jgi:hypothetical protein
MSSGGSEAQVFLSINLLMEKLERLNGDLETMMNEKWTTNPIVGNVLVMAAKAMGLAKGDEDIDVNTDFISDILNELQYLVNVIIWLSKMNTISSFEFDVQATQSYSD